MKSIVIVNGDEGDWLGVYLDGVLVYQGHSIEPSRLLEIIGISHTNSTVPMNGGGHLPRTLAGVKGYGG
jgi:hypothetical protein